MKLIFNLLLIFASFLGSNALPMVTKVAANDMECFYGQVDTLNSKVGLYFAVQSGGSFDIDLMIRSPTMKLIYLQEKESQGEFAFTATEIGEFEFCFSNSMSTFAEKAVEFEIIIDNSALKAELPQKAGAEDADTVETSINSIESRTTNIQRGLLYYRTRNHRNESTVKSTESRIFWFSVFEVLLMVGMGVLQVTVVQLFFTGSRKQLV